ncbi:MAG: hypothetical protein HYV07_06630 [Deltaproteobacteria bacterium]|nr:hypothetical protein [Deltaproteobacteria bacterium]
MAIPLDQRRIDLLSQAHQTNIQPGSSREIPKTSIGIGQHDPKRGQSGWERQEAIQQTIGSGWVSGDQGSWQSFANGRKPAGGRSSRGSVEVDGAAMSAKAPAEAPKLEQAKTGWDRLRMVFQSAAEFEETQRAGSRGVLGFLGV